MPQILIDTNAYLSFYRGKLVRSLLPVLHDVAADIFVTRQIVDEVIRNRVEVASAFLEDHLPPVAAPNLGDLFLRSLNDAVLDDQTAAEIRRLSDELRDGVKKLRGHFAALNKATSAARTAAIRQVWAGTDPTSFALQPIWERAKAPTDEQIRRARRRKVLGNPPGKGSAIGDELNWEQFLDGLQRHEPVWIITSDGDYCARVGGELLLHAPLMAELTSRVEPSEVHCFDDIALGLQAVGHTSGSQSVPDDEEIKMIRQEQASAGNAWVSKHAAAFIADRQAPGSGPWQNDDDVIPPESKLYGQVQFRHCGEAPARVAIAVISAASFIQLIRDPDATLELSQAALAYRLATKTKVLWLYVVESERAEATQAKIERYRQLHSPLPGFDHECYVLKQGGLVA